MDELYETGELTAKQATNFERWLDNMIGTDVECNEAGNGLYYLIISDLRVDEVDMIRNYENRRGFNNVD